MTSVRDAFPRVETFKRDAVSEACADVVGSKGVEVGSKGLVLWISQLVVDETLLLLPSTFARAVVSSDAYLIFRSW